MSVEKTQGLVFMSLLSVVTGSVHM